MGNFWTHSNSSENNDNSSNVHYYFYPPKQGRYFGSTFIMGNDKFDVSQPESYLFGENYDLNYLGGKPSPFPYTAPFPNEPMQMLKSLIHIRKETIKLINPDSEMETSYTIEFIFDSDVDCSITIYFLCKEDISVHGLKYVSKDPTYRSETFHYKAGIGQLFSQSSTVFNPQNYNISDLLYNILDDKGEFNTMALYPVVINCIAEEGDEPRQSHSLIAIIEKVYDQIFSLKPIKQKIFVDGLTYLLQEIYGIENKTDKTNNSNCDDDNDKSFECVICMSDLRDTLILPCRHLSLCKNCADSLLYQANNCPICRVPFRALLQIKAVKRITGQNQDRNDNNSQMTLTDSFNDVMIDLQSGYETIPLVEALNGVKIEVNSAEIVTENSDKIVVDENGKLIYHSNSNYDDDKFCDSNNLDKESLNSNTGKYWQNYVPF